MKQRLVGAIVLVALGVIFIPMILSGGKDELPLFTSNIPKQPQEIKELKSFKFSKQPEPAPAPPLIRVPVDQHSASVQPGKPAKPTAAEEAAAKLVEKEAQQASQKKPAKAWAVQVGSFSRQENALALRDKLRKKKYPSFVEQVKGKNGTIFRVRVGPEATRTDAEKTMRKLREKLKIYGVVMRHP